MNKTLVIINSNNYASTGNVMFGVAKEARNAGYLVYTCCKKSRFSSKRHFDNQIYIGIWLERVISEKLSIITGLKNHFNILGTTLFLKKLDEIKPDLIQLHSIVDTYINTKMLFAYIKKNNIPVVWTFHDPWAFTGQCIQFNTIKCEKWKNGCHHCELLHNYPKSLLFDFTNYLWKEKRGYMSGLNMTIVTPSNWLTQKTKESFLKEYDVKTIYNGINLDIFKPTNNAFRKKYNLEDSYILLGVAYEWAFYKGIDIFIKLAKELPSKYKIVLIGKLTNKEDLPSNVIQIDKTYDQNELADIYSSADLFVNPTRADNFPTVNIEALACGTPIITYNTGGSPEALDETCGYVVLNNDYDTLKTQIMKICEEKLYSKENCLKRSKRYDVNTAYKEYVELFDYLLM